MRKNHRKNWVYTNYAAAPRGFVGGVIDGITGLADMWDCTRAKITFTRHYRSGGIAGDWKMVGRDMRTALEKAEDERAA